MSTYDERAVAQASRMLAPKPKGKGQVVTITTPGTTTNDPATDMPVVGAPIIQTGSGVATKFSALSIDGTLILAKDRKFLLSPVKIDGTPIVQPVPDRDTITLADSKTYAIKKCDPLAPAGLAAMYTLQLRAS